MPATCVVCDSTLFVSGEGCVVNVVVVVVFCYVIWFNENREIISSQ